jgi:hypothetical protein
MDKETILLTIGIIVVSLVIFFAIRVSHAGGPHVVTFQQNEDCEAVYGWRLYTNACTPPECPGLPVGGSQFDVPRDEGFVCGQPYSPTVTLGGISGDTRFWLVAVDAQGFTSSFSNWADAVVALAAPVIISIQPE